MARQLEINHQAARIHDRRDHRRRHDRRVEMDRLRRNRKHTSDRLRDDNRAEQADNYRQADEYLPRILDHQALHSWKLAFRHPVTGAQMQFKADPPWKLP